MFEKDTEKKIIDYVKNSPIGVTSSEIARYLGISRITITKYLAIIKEKTLLDFRQFGMAKLWFIPINLNKDVYLKKITLYLASNIQKGDQKELLSKAGFDMSNYIEKLYLDHYRTDKMSWDQIKEAVIDAYSKIDGSIKIVERDKEKILFRMKKSPLGEDIADSYVLFPINAGIIGGLMVKRLDWCKVCLKPAPKDEGLYDILVYIQKSKKSEEEEGIEYMKKI